MGENLLKEIEKGSKMAVMKKKIITHYIYNGSSTITDLAREMDLSVPTVTKFIDEMCEEGYINDYGKLETSGGRHPSLYGLNADSGYFVGVEVRQFSINLGLINFKGDVVQLKMNVPFKAKNTPESLDELCKLIKHFLQKVSVEKDKILNINVNLSGRVNPDLGYSYSIFNFDERPLTDVISEKVGGYRVSIDPDDVPVVAQDVAAKRIHHSKKADGKVISAKCSTEKQRKKQAGTADFQEKYHCDCLTQNGFGNQNREQIQRTCRIIRKNGDVVF